MAEALIRLRLSQTNRPVDVLKHWSERDDGLYLDPPYQRGDVWGTKRRVNLIRSILIGVPIPSMIVNDRFAAGWKDDYRLAVIDGKQRITTVLMFLADGLPVPGGWFGVAVPAVRFSELPIAKQRCFRNAPLPFSEGQLPSLDAEREVFDLVNFGGLAQGEADA